MRVFMRLLAHSVDHIHNATDRECPTDKDDDHGDNCNLDPWTGTVASSRRDRTGRRYYWLRSRLKLWRRTRRLQCTGTAYSAKARAFRYRCSTFSAKRIHRSFSFMRLQKVIVHVSGSEVAALIAAGQRPARVARQDLSDLTCNSLAQLQTRCEEFMLTISFSESPG